MEAILGVAFFASAPLGDRISASLDDRIETHPYPSRGGDKVEGMDVGGDLLGVAFFYFTGLTFLTVNLTKILVECLYIYH